MIEAVVGPMWSRKTGMLIERAHHAEEKKTHREIVAIKPLRDTRDPLDDVDPRLRSRTGLTYPCTRVPDDLLENYKRYAEPGCLLIFDEAMLARNRIGLVRLVEEFLVKGGDLLIAGLELTSERRPFGAMPQIIQMAHVVTYLRARCVTKGCIYPASETFFDGFKDQDEKVGDEGFEPRCLTCWEIGFASKSQQPA